MNLHTFGDRWIENHPHDCYLPPFLGGPMDEIFMSHMRGRNWGPNTLLLSKQEKFLKQVLKQRHEQDNKMKRKPRPFPKIKTFRTYDTDHLLQVMGHWVQVSDVPHRLYHIVYFFFTRMGTVETMRAVNDNSFYVLYKDPRDTLRALTYNKRRLIFHDDIVVLNCQLLKKSEVRRICMERSDVVYTVTSDDNADEQQQQQLLQLQEEDDEEDEEEDEEDEPDDDDVDIDCNYDYDYDYDSNLTEFCVEEMQIKYHPYYLRFKDQRRLFDEAIEADALDRWYNENKSTHYFYQEFGPILGPWRYRCPPMDEVKYKVKYWAKYIWNWIKQQYNELKAYLRNEMLLYYY